MGHTWEYKYLQLACVFLGVLAINRSESWAPLAKVFGGLCYMLGVLLPTVSQGDEGVYSPLKVCLQLVLFTNVPIFITGVSLLLPRPMLSLNKCQEVVTSLCNKLSITLDSQVDAFLFPDQADLHMSMAAVYMTEAKTLLDTLQQLQSTLKKESYIFPSLCSLNEMLTTLIPLLSNMLDNLWDLKEIGKDISPNHTQAMFITLLQAPLQRFQEAMHVLLEDVIVSRVSTVQCCGVGRRGNTNEQVHEGSSGNSDTAGNNVDDDSVHEGDEKGRGKYVQLSKRSSAITSNHVEQAEDEMEEERDVEVGRVGEASVTETVTAANARERRRDRQRQRRVDAGE